MRYVVSFGLVAAATAAVVPSVSRTLDLASIGRSDLATECCSVLASSGLKHVIYPGDEVYEERIDEYFSISEHLRPFCLVRPTSAEEVSLAVTTLSQNTTCEFAVRSGGHMTWPGAANTETGVTIDMGLVNYTTYVPETQTAQIGTGSRWMDVYAELERHGVMVVGGRTSTVGVGGYMLGGGNSYYTGRRGFACDNVVNFEIVLATGEIVNANAEQNPDLWKALKGGSTNFGIVTRVDLVAFEAPDLWGGLVTYPASTIDQQIEAHVDWTNNVENHPDSSVIIFIYYEPNGKEIMVQNAYDDTTGAVAPPAFDKFLAIPDQINNSMRHDTLRNLAIELSIADGYRQVWFSISFKNDIRMYRKAVETHKRFVDGWKAQSPDGDFYCYTLYQALPTIFSAHSVERGGNVLGLDRETQNAVMFSVQLAFHGDAGKEQVAREQIDEFRTTLKDYSVEIGAAVDWEYLNYADKTQNPLKAYGKANVDLLRQVAAKYDPTGVFQTRMTGGFKISEVDE